ncbi:hypothetical protein [Salirhabdus sp. Marseille-P4669]|uniref:hypothetical protein n=1 Tax=Salirhabdus sp. Marseille-P4669 TaxID=2042310 RepID=UPI000C7D99A3|nr:hypothetical protein [Salirhabdus sp. Marseille-P4669]
MKKFFCFCFGMFLVVTGCKDVSDEPTKAIQSVDTKYDIYDFSYIKKAPDADEEHPIDDVIKIYFSEWSMEGSTVIAIDVENREIFKDPHSTRNGIESFEDPVFVEDAREVLKIIEKYNVQKWKEDYTFEDPSTYEDGISFDIWIQFSDGTVDRHGGAGTSKSAITREGFDTLAKELIDFVDTRL